jgi:GAF domain-containing protein/HAMP domain-containing protein
MKSMRRLYPRNDGLSIIIMVAAAQAAALLGAIPGYLLIRFNADLSEQQSRALNGIIPILILLSFLILIYLTWRITPSARRRLDEGENGRTGSNPEIELNAWREITGLTWRYGAAAIPLIFFLNVLPAYLICIRQGGAGSSISNPLSLDAASPAIVLLGGTAAMLGSVILAVFLIGRLTLPARLLLVPKDFDAQLRGRAGALVASKFQTLTLVLVLIAILLSAPIGYQQAVRILQSGSTSADTIADLQVRSILFTALALLLGIGYSYYASRSISDPVHELIQTFDRIEKGDLSARAPISATDELGIVTMQFNRMVTRLEKLQNQLEVQVAERTKQLTATNELGRVASSSLNPDQLLVNVMNLFRKQFDYYFAAIYLLDPSEKWAELREGTGEPGILLKQNHHRLEVAANNPVGRAIREKSSSIFRFESDARRRDDNQLLPYTRSVVAIPLMAGDRVLGALEVQSTKPDDFPPDVVDTMANMAGQVAIALENARLFQEAQHNILELRAIQQQYLVTGWSGYSGASEELEYAVGDESDTAQRRIEVPISLRDQVLGQIKLEGNAEWTPEQLSLVDAVATQAAIAVENARLVSESRQAAVRERMLADINSRIWSSATIDAVLQTAVRELGRRLDASRVTIELSIEDTE